jgi:hypothetical protein
MSYFPIWTQCQNINWNEIQLYSVDSYHAQFENQTTNSWYEQAPYY